TWPRALPLRLRDLRHCGRACATSGLTATPARRRSRCDIGLVEQRELRRARRRRRIGTLEARRTHAEQPDATCEVDAREAAAAFGADRRRVLRRGVDRAIAGDAAEIVEAQLDADGARGIALAREVVGEALAKPGEDGRELGAVALHVEIAVERRLAADRARLARRLHKPRIDAVGGVVHP